MISSLELCEFIERGGVLCNVEGSTPAEIYRKVVDSLSLPADVDKELVFNELCEREKVLSTAVGNGIAIPHPRRPIMKTPEAQRIVVCFLKNPINMNAPDSLSVHTMFILLSASSQVHINVLSSLAKLIRKNEFKKLLETKPTLEQLVTAIKQTEFN